MTVQSQAYLEAFETLHPGIAKALNETARFAFFDAYDSIADAVGKSIAEDPDAIVFDASDENGGESQIVLAVRDSSGESIYYELGLLSALLTQRYGGDDLEEILSAVERSVAIARDAMKA